MKRINFNIILISILLISIGCKEKVEDNSGDGIITGADCFLSSFKENYLENFLKDEILFIKGVALNVYEYGRNIEVIEDLKGNFVGESSIFVWGGGYPSNRGNYICISNEKLDDITKYQKNDTLIMLVSKKTVIHDECIESIGDYTTIGCSYSILKLSNGFATGYILPREEDAFLWEEMTMSWKDLQKELQELEAKKGGEQ